MHTICTWFCIGRQLFEVIRHRILVSDLFYTSNSCIIVVNDLYKKKSAELHLELLNIAMHGWETWYVHIFSQSCVECMIFQKLKDRSVDCVVLLIQPCNNPSCLYLHTMGADEDSFGKDEAAAVHTRYQISLCIHLNDGRSSKNLNAFISM